MHLAASGSLGSSPWLCRLPAAALSPGHRRLRALLTACPTLPSRPWTGPCPPPGPQGLCPPQLKSLLLSQKGRKDCAPEACAQFQGPAGPQGGVGAVWDQGKELFIRRKERTGSWGPDAQGKRSSRGVSRVHTRASWSPACLSLSPAGVWTIWHLQGLPGSSALDSPL